MAAITVLVLALFFPLITSFPLLSLPVDGTACDWNVWDDTAEEKSVQKISIRCSNGQIIWRTPYGGLAITFLPPLKSQHYELCFIAESAFATVQFFLEGNHSLNQLAVLGEVHSAFNHEICLTSTADHEIVIFIETDSSSSSPVHGKVMIEYDVRAIKPTAADQMQDCSPCSEEETLLAACTTDYAVVGQIHSVSESSDSDMTDLNVIVSHVIRQQYKVVRDSLDDLNHGSYQSTYWQHNSQNRKSSDHAQYVRMKSVDSSERRARNSRESKSFLNGETLTNSYLPIVVPGKCQVRQGKGFFLFLGSIRLRRARLQCAPRLEEFEYMWNNAAAVGNIPCTLY